MHRDTTHVAYSLVGRAVDGDMTRSQHGGEHLRIVLVGLNPHMLVFVMRHTHPTPSTQLLIGCGVGQQPLDFVGQKHTRTDLLRRLVKRMMGLAGVLADPHVHFVQFFRVVAERNPHCEYTSPTVARDETILVEQRTVHIAQCPQTSDVKSRPEGTPTKINGRREGRRRLAQAEFDFVVFGGRPFGRIGRFDGVTRPPQIVPFQSFLGTVAGMGEPFGGGRAGHVDGGFDELLVGVVVLMSVVEGRQESIHTLGGG